MKIVVREASLEDAELIANLTRNAWKNTVAPSSAGHYETEEKVLGDLQRGGGFIMLINDIPAGSVRWLPLDENHDIWEIQRLCVLPDFRGRELSSHLLETIIHHAQMSEAHELRLALLVEQEHLFDHYAAFGFEMAPELENYFSPELDPSPMMLRRKLEE